MLIIASDGRIEDRQLSTQTIPSNQGKYTIAESWTDSKGNIYCTVDTKWKIGWYTQDLWKLDKSGNIFERNYKLTIDEEYPTKIDSNPDPDAATLLYYCIYYRQ